MKKLLLIAYYFPPQSDTGAQRPHRIARYLPCFGWDPVVLTTKASASLSGEMRLVLADYRDLLGACKRLFGFDPGRGLREQLSDGSRGTTPDPGAESRLIDTLKQIIAYPDEQRGWYRGAVRAASEFLGREKVDAIVSTSYPVTSHLVGRTLKQRFGIPWVADLRDLWTQNHYCRKNGVVEFLERRLELRTLGDADALVTVSGPLAAALGGLHEAKRVVCITNGYDPEEAASTGNPPEGAFTITYTGTLYGGRRDPSMLFGVLRELIDRGDLDPSVVRVSFIGPREPAILRQIEGYGLKGVVTLHGPVTRQEALRLQRESQLLLLLLWDHPQDSGVYTAKVFEYLAARRPIVATGGTPGVVSELLEATQAGHFASGSESLREIILEYYQEYRNSGVVRWKGTGRVEDYSYETIARQYAGLLEGLTYVESGVTA